MKCRARLDIVIPLLVCMGIHGLVTGLRLGSWPLATVLVVAAIGLIWSQVSTEYIVSERLLTIRSQFRKREISLDSVAVIARARQFPHMVSDGIEILLYSKQRAFLTPRDAEAIMGSMVALCPRARFVDRGREVRRMKLIQRFACIIALILLSIIGSVLNVSGLDILVLSIWGLLFVAGLIHSLIEHPSPSTRKEV